MLTEGIIPNRALLLRFAASAFSWCACGQPCLFSPSLTWGRARTNIHQGLNPCQGVKLAPAQHRSPSPPKPCHVELVGLLLCVNAYRSRALNPNPKASLSSAPQPQQSPLPPAFPAQALAECLMQQPGCCKSSGTERGQGLGEGG